MRDLHKILRDLFAFDRRITAPAAAVDHLFIGEHGHVVRTPVHWRGLLVDQALVEQLGEQPLLPAVILRVAGGDLTVPVITKTESLQLVAHVVDVFVGPLCRRHLVLDRGVLGRQAKGIPAHWLHDVLAQHALVAANHITNGVITHMAHVQAATRVREHGQAVELLAALVLDGAKRVVLLPILASRFFNTFRVILCLIHYSYLPLVKGRKDTAARAGPTTLSGVIPYVSGLVRPRRIRHSGDMNKHLYGDSPNART